MGKGEVQKHKGICVFCSAGLTYSIIDGKKVLDAPCNCIQSKNYFNSKAQAEREAQEQTIRVKLGHELEAKA